MIGIGLVISDPSTFLLPLVGNKPLCLKMCVVVSCLCASTALRLRLFPISSDQSLVQHEFQAMSSICKATCCFPNRTLHSNTVSLATPVTKRRHHQSKQPTGLGIVPCVSTRVQSPVIFTAFGWHMPSASLQLDIDKQARKEWTSNRCAR